MGYQICPTCHGQRFNGAPITTFRFLLGLMKLDPSLRDTCDECQGRGRLTTEDSEVQEWVDPEQPDGYQTTAAFAQFVAEPQSPALRGPKRQPETTT